MRISDWSSDVCSSDLGASTRPMFEFRNISARQKQTVLVRAVAAGVFALLCLLLLAGRMWYLQVVRYENLSARADQNRNTIVHIPPRRGQIIDRNGAVLARNHRDYTLSVTRARVDGKKIGRDHV